MIVLYLINISNPLKQASFMKKMLKIFTLLFVIQNTAALEHKPLELKPIDTNRASSAPGPSLTKDDNLKIKRTCSAPFNDAEIKQLAEKFKNSEFGTTAMHVMCECRDRGIFNTETSSLNFGSWDVKLPENETRDFDLLKEALRELLTRDYINQLKYIKNNQPDAFALIFKFNENGDLIDGIELTEKEKETIETQTCLFRKVDNKRTIDKQFFNKEYYKIAQKIRAEAGCCCIL